MSLPGGEPRAEQLMTIVASDVGDCRVLEVSGEIDLATEGRLVDAADVALDAAATGAVILDLTEVSFLSSSALGQLFALDERARRIGVPLRIVVGDHRSVLRPILAMRLDAVLSLYSTALEALTD